MESKTAVGLCILLSIMAACGSATTASKGRTSADGIRDILDLEANTRFALDVIKMKDTAAFFWVQFLVMYTVKWLFYIMLSLVTWDREIMSLICAICLL